MPRRRCPQCKGEKVVKNEDSEEENGEEMIECPECTGKGWIIFIA